ncbi:MAG: alanine racemase [Elusimicrobia bacterium GWC2_65_9]|nr:MAG: alanine racemase [Elusimicrobia bacterium GWA2_66_18]OGR70470.1 MAG: alanine racemase [Elusimicrobia bacterium GWC2_65_9]
MSEPKDLKWVEIDLSAVAQNARWVVSRLEGAARLLAVVKADAYGHGAVEVSHAALKAGACGLGVRDLCEASVLRKAGLRAPILLLAPILPEQAGEAARLRVTATVDAAEQARALQAAAGGRRVGVHVDVDSGLGRWGVAPRALHALMMSLSRLPRVRVEGLSTHIDYVPGKNAVEAEEKLGAFRRLAAPYKKKDPGLVVHAANSSVFVDFPHHRFDMACAGNLLYGINPSKSRPAPLKNPWRFCARIISLREMRKGTSIGYASEYVAAKRMRIATLPVGYADGLTMEPAERLIGFGGGFQYWGMCRGMRLPFVGRCGITHVLVDATDAPDAKAGDVVTLPVRRTAARHLRRVYL